MPEQTTTLEQQIADLEGELRAIAPEVLSGDAKAVAKRWELQAQIQTTRDEIRLRDMANQEERRREDEAAQADALAKQEEAKQEYLRLFEERIEVNRQIEKQLAGTVELLRKHKDLGDRASAASNRWGQPDNRLRRPEALVNLIHDYFGQIWPDDFVRRSSNIRSLAETESRRLEAMKHPARKVAPAKAVKPEEPKTFTFSPVRTVVEVEEGRFTAHDDPKVRDALAQEAESKGRAVFVGGHVHPVTAFQADRLRLQGFAQFVTRDEGEKA